jgi:hypothetical protein
VPIPITSSHFSSFIITGQPEKYEDDQDMLFHFSPPPQIVVILSNQKKKKPKLNPFFEYIKHFY